MFASYLAAWLTRRGIHYGWFMVAITFLTTVCSSAAISLAGILVLPLIQEFGWGRTDIAAVMGLMLLLFAGTAPFAGAIMLRYGLCRTVGTAVAMTLLGLWLTARMATLWQFSIGFGVLLGTAAGVLALALPASIANRWFTERRGLAMGILTAAFAAGQLTFMPANAWLATEYGWRMALLPVAIGCALCPRLAGRRWHRAVRRKPRAAPGSGLGRQRHRAQRVRAARGCRDPRILGARRHVLHLRRIHDRHHQSALHTVLCR